MALNIVPVSDYLIVQTIDTQPVGGSLLLPFDAKGPQYARVLAAGPGQMLPSGQLAPMPCKAGDTVLLQINAGTEVKLGRETYRFVLARDLFGVVPQAMHFQVHSVLDRPA